MGRSVALEDSAAHRLNVEVGKPKAAKVDLIKHENRDFRRETGIALMRARSIVGWTQNQLAMQVADVLEKEFNDSIQAQVSRWESGKEGMPIAVLLAIQPLAWPLLRCLAELDSQNEVVTEIRRRA